MMDDTWYTDHNICAVVSGRYRCDREKGHSGEHRGYNLFIDESVFWSDAPLVSNSAQPCGCDAGANYKCEQHR
jgi:hypothetical protein